MKKIVLLALMAAACTPGIAQKKSKSAPPAKPAAQETRKSLAIGSEIPMAGMIFDTPDGRLTSLDQAKQSNGLLVMFSCNTCPYVVKAQQHTINVMNEAEAARVGMVVVNSNEAQRDGADARDRMKLYAQEQHYKMPYLIDVNSQLADAFGATRTPEVFLFDGNGKLVYKGAIEDNPADPEKSKEMYVVKAMKEIAGGKPVSKAETKSIGCGIKRMNM